MGGFFCLFLKSMQRRLHLVDKDRRKPRKDPPPTHVTSFPPQFTPSTHEYGPYSPIDCFLRRIDEHHRPIKHQSIHFEISLFLYLISHLFLQNYNIYQANFYNYNFSLLFLTIILLSERFRRKYMQQVKREHPIYTGTHILLNVIIISLVVINACYFIAQLLLSHSLTNCLFLCYPPLMLAWGFRRKRQKEYDSMDAALAWRLRKILLTAFNFAYYIGLLPLKFLQHDYLYFDMVRCVLLLVYVFLNSFVMLFAQLLLTSFNDLYLQSQLLGYWKSFSPANDAERKYFLDNAKEWKEDTIYPKGTVLLHQGKLFIAQGEENTCRPDSGFLIVLLFHLFNNPERMHVLLIGLQLFVVMSQLALLINSNYWNVYGVMIIFNYYILYLCINTRRQNMGL